jgi:hypothetical protein
MILKFLAAAAVLIFTLQVQAGVLFEPYAGYTIGNMKLQTTSTFPVAAMQDHAYTASADGFAYGAKLAWDFSGLYVGAEYQAARAQQKLSGATTPTDWTNTSVFGIVGWQMLNGVRLTGGTTVVPHKSVEGGDPDPTVFEGRAWKAGIGFRYRVPFAVNVDYIKYDLTKYKVGGSEGDVKDNFKKFDYSAFLISFSFPFEFGL